MNAPPARVAADAAPIGGFFQRHGSDGAVAGLSILDAWTEGRRYAAFVNARSAFAALAAAFPQAVVWLPAFLCEDMAQSAYADRTRFYPVEDGFEPELDIVTAEAKAGDLVLVVAYFGLPVSQRVWATLARRRDLRIVEDRAQALGPGLGDGPDWRLHSPRKLLGVADGGLLIARDDTAFLPRPSGAPESTALWAAPLLRQADPLGRDNAAWHAANQAKEAAMGVTSQAITDLSLAILSQTSLETLAGARLRNWRTLDARLRRWSALPADPAAPPLGYVLRLDPQSRDRLLRGLHAERIFAAVHWPRTAGPPEAFPREARWTRELITLPCDHRYVAADMARIAGRVTDLLG